jgi:hypothetical protein
MFQNVQIRSKLIAILVGPLLALTILSSVGIGTNLAQSAEADRVNRLSLFTGKISALVNELQEERSRSLVYLGPPRRGAGPAHRPARRHRPGGGRLPRRRRRPRAGQRRRPSRRP